MSHQVQPMNKLEALSKVLRVEVITSEADFDALKHDWDELLDDSNQRVYFLRWSWNRHWWRAYAPPHGRLYLVTCRDESGQLVGLAPLYWRQASSAAAPLLREVLFLGTGIPITTSEHLDLITRRGYEQPVAAAVVARVIKDRQVDRLWLSEIPITSILLPHLRRAIGPRHQLRVCNRSHYIDTCGEWDSIKRSLGRSMKAQLGGKTRRLLEVDNCRFHCVETPEELEPAMDSLVRLHQARWRSKGEPGSFALSSFEGFLKASMRSSFANGRVLLWTIELEGQTAATLLAFVDNGIAHYFQGGFDPAYSKYSLGSVMLGLCLRACIDEKQLCQFNFMGGDTSYKARWTNLGLDSVELEWLRPGLRSILFQLYQGAVQRGKSLVRALVPKSIRATRRAAKRKRIQGG
jgi:CelD/BcsL family acetyltransferase involved in cellulose biosynthesis